MKPTGPVLAALAALASPAGAAQPATTGFLDRTVSVDGRPFPYQVYVPRDWTATKAWPVVLFLHRSPGRWPSSTATRRA